jgi:phosphomannomutase
MSEIKIGTEGWQAIIANQLTVENIRRVAEATALWMKKKDFKKVMIGFDCRFGGLMFSRKVAKIMAANGFEVLACENFITTAMLASGVLQENADLGIMITGGIKPYFFNGFKVISSTGGRQIHDIENYIPIQSSTATESTTTYKQDGRIAIIDLEEAYLQRALDRFDIDALVTSGLRIVIDSMHGSSQSILQKLLPTSLRLRMDYNPSFNNTIPNPIPANLTLLHSIVSNTDYTSFGVGLSGAAERFLILDENGKFIDFDHIKTKIPSIADIEDGVWIVLTILEHLMLTGKKLSEI